MSKWVYCHTHIRPHISKWCGYENHIELKASSYEEAKQEIAEKQLPRFGYCNKCYKDIHKNYYMSKECEDCANENIPGH